MTLCGRTIVKHQSSKTNELITGVYQHDGDAVAAGDTDSVVGDSIIRLSDGRQTTIENLFLNGTTFWKTGEKEYSKNDETLITHFSMQNNNIDSTNYNYVYRHKVSKKKYRINTSDGKSVIVTEDHSIMVLENGILVEKKPKDIIPGDKVITLVHNI